MKDEEAGSILFTFLSSLRDSYEDAVGGQDGKKMPAAPNSETKPSTTNSQRGTKEVTAAPKSKSVRKPKKASTSQKPSSKPQPKSSQSADAARYDSNQMTSMSRLTAPKRKKPASVTEASSGSSSQPTTEQSSSSLEDSDSKSDKTSSDESDKETRTKSTSKGPPRKRLKQYHQGNEFTRENLLEHSKRMNMER